MRATEPIATRVLLVVDDGPAGHSLLQALEAVTIQVEWARTVPELRRRAARDDLRMPEVVFLDLEMQDAAVDEVVPLVRGNFPLAAVVALADDLSGESAARLLCLDVASLNKPVSSVALAGLALRLSSGPRSSSWRAAAPAAPLDGGDQRSAHLESIFHAYAAERGLSKQQRLILSLYLSGMNDKEIASSCRCSEATVYEHWRRMARKAGGSQKGDVIADFHRLLGGDRSRLAGVSRFP
jgi:DNA-binding NarL/FixJ family response regulator